MYKTVKIIVSVLPPLICIGLMYRLFRIHISGKIPSRVILGGTFILLWFSFGCLYWLMSLSSSMTNFIYNEDVRLSSQANIFKSMINRDIDEQILKELIKKNENAFPMQIGDSETGKITLMSSEPLGLEWGAFYEAVFLSQGLNAFYLIPGDNSDTPPLRLSNSTHRMADFFLKNQTHSSEASKKEVSNSDKEDVKQMYSVILVLGEDKSSDDKGQFVEKERHILWFEKPIITQLSQNKIIFPTKDFLRYALSENYIFFDKSAFSLMKVKSGETPLPFIDFLYFSAITITTVGYGDILPVSSIARLAVMIEAMLGIILAGLFVSSVAKSEEKNTSNAQSFKT